jgi:hypothetical protein
MKKTIASIGLALIASTLTLGIAEAKSVKWYCYAPDPANPWVQTCYSSSNRP